MKDSIPGKFTYAQKAALNTWNSPNNLVPPTDYSAWSLAGPTSPGPISPQGSSCYHGRVDCITKHPTNPNICYIGTSHSGVWKSTNYTSATPTWINITDYLRQPGLGVLQIVIEPVINPLTNQHTMWIATGDYRYEGSGYGIGILRSTDGGNTWNMTTRTPSFIEQQTTKIVVDYSSPVGNRTLYAAINDYIYKSTDDGVNWNRLNNSQATQPPVTSGCYTPSVYVGLTLSPTNNSLLFASSNTTHNSACNFTAPLMKSTDAGNTWSDISGTLPNPSNVKYESIDVQFSTSSPNVVYLLAIINNSHPVIYKSVNSGQSFSIINLNPQLTQATGQRNLGCSKFIVSPIDENVLYFFESAYAGRSNDGGLSVYEIPTCHADVRDITVTISSVGGLNDVVEAATDGGLSTHSYTLSPQSPFPSEVLKTGTGLSITQFFGIDVAQSNSDLVAGGTQDNSVIYFFSGLWKKTGSCDCYHALIDKDCEQQIYVPSICQDATKSDYGYVTIGGNYDTHNTRITDGPFRFNRPFKQHNSTSTLYAAQSNLSIIPTATCPMTTPYSYITSPVAHNVNASFMIFAMDVNQFDPNCITVAYYKSSGTNTPAQIVYRSTNGGQSWTDISATLLACQWFVITDLVSDPTNPNRIWATVGGFDLNSQRRVYYTANGGTNWTDVSSGLPIFPANCIIYEEGSNDNLYVGTDEGVYYHNATMTSPYWQPFMNGIPLSANVMDLKINYCRKEIYAATFGRGIWKSPTAAANPANTSAAQAPQTISTSTNWTGTHIINSDLIIPPGVTLTISGASSKLLMSENRKIIVQRGGKLIVDAATISNGCGKKWYGIEVWGNQTLSQLPLSTTPQGYVEIRNGATLQHMQEGIITDRAGYSGYHGGIIVGNNAVFRDNLKAVQILSYLNFTTGGGSAANLCQFTNCTFEITAGWPAAFGPAQKQVRMDAVEDVKFRACTFLNTASITQLPTASRGTAIESLDARYSLEGYCAVAGCSNPVRSRVEGFYYGINTSAANPLKTMSVTYTDFVNNERGTLLTGLNYATVALCAFATNGSANAYGLYLDACSGYQVEQNAFSSPTANNGFGLFVRNSNNVSNLNGYGNTNIIYNNSFIGFAEANVAYDDNDGPATYDGVRFNCNDYSGNSFDIRVLSLVGNPIKGVFS